jgi:flavin reductase (DIM6/NTAB) family NADH-FMN oxidoreductase RutF
MCHKCARKIAPVVSGDELRAVMGRFPAGVAVVTVELRGQRAGLTVASLVSLSLEPPLVGFAIRRDAALHELLRDAGTFAVSLLGEGQESLAQHFARGVPPIALWERIAVRNREGPPELEGAIAWLGCAVTAEHPAGDHTFFVGEVVRVGTGPEARPPLVFYRQSYRTL